MIENLVGLHETVNYKKNMKIRVHNNDEYENYPPHWHTPFELVMPVKNIYTVICANQKYVLREGDILIICPGVIHEMIAPPTGLRIFFQPSLTNIDLQELDLIMSMITPSFLIRHEDAPEIHSQLHKLMLEVRDEYFQNPPYAESYMYAKFLEMLVLVGRYHAEIAQQHFEAKNDKQQEYIEKFMYICNYINEHFAEPLTLEGVAALAGFSKYHFTRLFKQYADTSFYQYLNQKRIAHAKQLLVDKNFTVLEVALQCGFSNLSSFLRMFKQIAGCTPTELRKIYQGNF